MTDDLEAYYLERLSKNLDPSQQLGWEDQEAHYKRFGVLCREINLEGMSILDFGSGLGDLYGFLKRRDIRVRYHGVDILPQMVERAKRRFSKADFECRDVLSSRLNGESAAYDVVYSAGAFNLKSSGGMAFLERAFDCFTGLSKAWIVLSLLDDRSPDREDSLYTYFNPKELMTTLQRPDWHFRYVDSYLPNDFTLIAHFNPGKTQ